MAEKKTYSEKLKDPRWQKKRLEIMQRDDFKCQMCSRSDIMLTVHHHYYTKDAEPWEYEDQALVTLCEICHKAEHDSRSAVEGWLLQDLKVVGATGYNVQILANYIRLLNDTGKLKEWLKEIETAVLDDEWKDVFPKDKQ